MRARAVGKSISLNRLPLITFEINDKEFINNEMLDGRELDLAVKIYRKKRSLNANAYMWELCSLLADKNSIGKDEVYREAVRATGVFRDIEITDDAVGTIQTAWGNMGTGWITEKVDKGNKEGTSIIRLYYGTSMYNTKQMSRIIDGLVQDCKACGIPTKDDVEIERLISEWNQ